MIKEANIKINMKSHDKGQRVLPIIIPEIRSSVEFLKLRIKHEICVAHWWACPEGKSLELWMLFVCVNGVYLTLNLALYTIVCSAITLYKFNKCQYLRVNDILFNFDVQYNTWYWILYNSATGNIFLL
jgi:hypothetical protein